VGRTHEEIVDARDAWEAGAARFGHVIGHADERVPAPPLPGVRLTQRRRRV
jgi:quercetin 2,3-dioxygenase